MNKTQLQKIYEFVKPESKNEQKININLLLAAALLVMSLFWLAFYFKIEFYVFLSVLALPLVWTMVNYPRIWIYFLVLGFTFFFTTAEKEVNASHILVGLFYNSFLAIWFINKLLIRREKICRNILDQIFLFFYLILIAHSAISVANGVAFFDWAREYLLYSLILYYFPIREYFVTKKHILRLLVLLGIVTVILDFYSFYNYYKILQDISYAYQFALSMRINQQLFVAVSLAGVAFFLYCKTIKGKLFSLFVAILTIGGLISTLSRAFWLAFLAITFVFLFHIKLKQIAQLIIVAAVFIGVSVIALQILMPDKVSLFNKYLTQRFTSTSQGKKDPSVRARLYEYREVIRLIEASPIWGSGLRKEFKFYSNIKQQTLTGTGVHNGYMNIAYRTGIPLTIAFYLPLFLYMIQGFLISIRASSYFRRTLAICGYLTLAMLFITNFVTSSFLFRDGLMVTALALALISIAEKTNQSEIF